MLLIPSVVITSMFDLAGVRYQMHEEAAKRRQLNGLTLNTWASVNAMIVSHGMKDAIEWFQIKNWKCVRCKRHFVPSKKTRFESDQI